MVGPGDLLSGMVVNSIMQNVIWRASIELGKRVREMTTQRISERAKGLGLENSRVKMPPRLSVESSEIKGARHLREKPAFQSLRHLRNDNQTNLVNNRSCVS